MKIILRLFVIFLASSVLFIDKIYAQKAYPVWAVKTNLLYDATTTLNLGIELKFSRKLTLELPVSYNPWTFHDNAKLKHITVQPELRYWLCESFSGHFFGLHGHYAFFNAGNIDFISPLADYRYEGYLWGAGISYGYQWILSTRWSMEATFGLGYARIFYDKYNCESCGDYINSDITNYYGPTKAGISLIYNIK